MFSYKKLKITYSNPTMLFVHSVYLTSFLISLHMSTTLDLISPCNCVSHLYDSLNKSPQKATVSFILFTTNLIRTLQRFRGF